MEQPLIPKTAAKAPFQLQQTAPLKLLLNPLAWLLWILDFCVFLLTIVGPIKWLLSCCAKRRAVSSVDKAGHVIWRDWESEKELVATLEKGLNTVPEVFAKACQRYATNEACGTRTYLGEHKPEWSKFPLKKFGETTWITYQEFCSRVNMFGAGLIKLGMKPTPPGHDIEASGGPHTMLIYEETCAQWVTACMGAHSQSIAVATSYSTLGISSVIEAINELGAMTIVCNIKDAEKVAKECHGKCPTLKVIIYSTNYSEVTSPEPSGALSKFTVLSVEEVIAKGKAADDIKPTYPTADMLALVMYTSGSTGKPKGVMITHANIAASVGALGTHFVEMGLTKGEETYLAYLPAAHILEFVAETAMFCLGNRVGFACPKTISSKGACRQKPDGTLNTRPDYPYPPGGIQEFRPTIMAAVPKIWDILKKGVEDVFGHMSPVMQWVIQVAFTGRQWAVSQGRSSPLFGLVFGKLSAMLGGRMKFGVSGGGALSSEVQTFMRVAFGMPLIQGYALTETTCAGTIQHPSDSRDGIIGTPVKSVEIRLNDCVGASGEAEIKDRSGKPYLSTDKFHYGMPCAGRGEIMVRGNSLSAGYFKQADKWAEVTNDTWFHTGDVGVVLKDGSFMIVDRVKNLVKLKGGEYIAIEAMESAYSKSAFVNGVNGGLMCYGDGNMDRPVALVQANTHELEKFAKGSGIEYNDVDALCKNAAVVKMVLEDLVKAGKAGGCGANEILAGIALISGAGSQTSPSPTSPWTPENGGLTASNKLNRKPIQSMCAPILDPLMKQGIRG